MLSQNPGFEADVDARTQALRVIERTNRLSTYSIDET